MSWAWHVATEAVPRWAPPLLALQFLTRIPVPGTAALSPAQARAALQSAAAWFPLVGTLVGSLTAALILLLARGWPMPVAVLAALAFEAWLTGAFHEDAVADFCDGMGGGHDAGQVRRIMKDSRIGTYGTLGVLFAVGLRWLATLALPPALLVAAIVAAATFARLQAVVMMSALDPVGEGATLAKDVGGRVPLRRLGLAVVLALPGLALLAWAAPQALWLAVAGAALFTWWLRRLLLRRLGGSVGDALGFAAYAAQLLVLLAASRA